MSKSQKRRLRSILISAFLFLFALIFPFDKFFPEKTSSIISAVIFLAAYLIVGWNVLYKAIRNILNGQVFDENFLMAVATIIPQTLSAEMMWKRSTLRKLKWMRSF